MTREDAINYLEMSMAIGEDDDSRHHNEVLEFTIKSLKQEPCEDCVSRKAVVEYIKNSDAELGHDCEKEIVVEDILTMPSVKPIACIATVKFSKEDMQELIDEKMKDIVVEREKIDKAIEEMDKLASHKVKPISFDQENAIKMCIEILKRNIGESK